MTLDSLSGILPATMKKDKPTRFPEDAKKVFDGIIYDVYQWPQEMYDGTTATYERLNRQDTIIVIGITEDKQILLVDEEQPHVPLATKFVAGKIDPGETPEQAASRELLEETGYQAEKMDLWFENKPDINIDWTVYTFIAKNIKKVAEQELENGEKITPKLFSFDKFIEFATSEKFTGSSIKIKVLEAQLDPQKMRQFKDSLLS